MVYHQIATLKSYKIVQFFCGRIVVHFYHKKMPQIFCLAISKMLATETCFKLKY